MKSASKNCEGLESLGRLIRTAALAVCLVWMALGSGTCTLTAS